MARLTVVEWGCEGILPVGVVFGQLLFAFVTVPQPVVVFVFAAM